MVRTSINERFFNSLLGTSVGNTLFELNNNDSGDFLEDEIEVLLKNFEPRVEVSRVRADSQVDSNNIFVQIEYDIVGLPVPLQRVEFLLQPTRI